MRILYDGFIYSLQKAGGINRYFANLIAGLPENFVPTLAIDEVRSINFPESASLEIINVNQHSKIPLSPRRFFQNFDSLYHEHYLAKIRARTFDLAHPTYYELLTHQPINSYKCPVVLTVYDMLHEKFMGHMDHASQGHLPQVKREAIEAATAIICISESTKRDLIEICNVPEEKISITYLASDFEAGMAYGDEPIPQKPYFLFVGSRAKYKNFSLFLSEFKRISQSQLDVQLCVAGSPFDDEEKAQIQALGLAGRIEFYGHPTDTHLAKLYRCSLAFVYPSLYEGFGIPPLEAMISGTVVIVSNTSSLPEVVGQAGLLFDPTEKDALGERMAAVAEGSVDRDAIIEAGRAQARRFNWETTIRQTVSVYESIAQHR